ncbi:GNAT family N-acetyltransferase, partial [Klebsiella aerogenes]
LWLRWPCARDAEAIATLAGDPAVAGMTAAIPLPLDRGTVDAFVIRNRRENAEGRALVLALSLREAPQGLVGL